MKSANCIALFLGLALYSSSSFAVETTLTCSEVAATETKCKDFDVASAACDVEVQAGIKTKIDAAKHAADECKKKNGISYVMKCKKEIKESATAINTPKQVAGSPIQKELSAKPDSSCAKADTLGNATVVCKGPKKILEAMKKNCIKDGAK
ncbi:MAG: hypothetical protein H7318_07530 [Oligoflexus sp.]|nr:hypothetical protein [Oligoflexus sp.]